VPEAAHPGRHAGSRRVRDPRGPRGRERTSSPGREPRPSTRLHLCAGRASGGRCRDTSTPHQNDPRAAGARGRATRGRGLRDRVRVRVGRDGHLVELAARGAARGRRRDVLRRHVSLLRAGGASARPYLPGTWTSLRRCRRARGDTRRRTRMVWFRDAVEPAAEGDGHRLVASAAHAQRRCARAAADRRGGQHVSPPGAPADRWPGADVVFPFATKYSRPQRTRLRAWRSRPADLADQLRFLQNAIGAVPGPRTATCPARPADARAFGPSGTRQCAGDRPLPRGPRGRRLAALPGPHGRAVRAPTATLAASQMASGGGMVQLPLRHGCDGERPGPRVEICRATRAFTRRVAGRRRSR